MKTSKYAPLPKLEIWLVSASTVLKQRLCTLAGTSDSMFRQWVVGRRALSADLAGRVSTAMKTIYKESGGKAPRPLTRGDLCEACRNCEIFQQDQAAKRSKKAPTDTPL